MRFRRLGRPAWLRGVAATWTQLAWLSGLFDPDFDLADDLIQLRVARVVARAARQRALWPQVLGQKVIPGLAAGWLEEVQRAFPRNRHGRV